MGGWLNAPRAARRFRVLRAGVEVPLPAFGRPRYGLLRLLAVRRPDLVPHDVLADRPLARPGTGLTRQETSMRWYRARTAVGDPGSWSPGRAGTLGPHGGRRGFRTGLPCAAAADPAAALGAATVALELWGEPLCPRTPTPTGPRAARAVAAGPGRGG
ncbi:hypothetical protein HBB16_18520 [Pseudonocardia sp. MCCB 268]|nr:hypothetical protein [Pseudonocardia cytotoxica]